MGKLTIIDRLAILFAAILYIGRKRSTHYTNLITSGITIIVSCIAYFAYLLDITALAIIGTTSLIVFVLSFVAIVWGEFKR